MAKNRRLPVTDGYPYSGLVALRARARVSRNTETPVTSVTGNLLSDLADRVYRLGPCRKDPERFHEDKSEIAYELRQIAEHNRGD